MRNDIDAHGVLGRHIRADGMEIIFEALRDPCSTNRILLILDEVQTGIGLTSFCMGVERCEGYAARTRTSSNLTAYH